MRRLKQLEQENARLKKLAAERDLEIEVMKEIAARNGERAGPSRAGGLRDAPRIVAAPVVRAVGSGAFGAALPLGEGGEDAPVLACMAALGAQYPRFGYRRIRIFLDREGHAMSWGRCYRLWRRARLQVPRRRPRKRIASGRPRPQAPTGAN